MNTLSDEQRARANKMHSRLLQALDKQKQCNVAKALGIHESTISRKKDSKDVGISDFELLCQLLAVLGLKIVPEHYKMLRPEVLQSMLAINKEFYRRISDIDDLAHDELSERDDLNY